MNYYELLQVSPHADSDVIEAAYKVLLKRHHPDRGHTLGSTAQKLGEAHLTLTTPRARARYDADLDKATDIKGKVIGEFVIESKIAEGGFGKTYKGRHLLVGEPVCIKHCSRISPADTEILISEAKAMWDLRHFGLPAVRNLFKLPDGSIILVMSYIEGPTLQQLVEQYVAKGLRLEPEHGAWILSRLINTLSYIHRHGIVHGDLKPQNILIQPESHMAVLVDFGLAGIKPTRTSGNKGYTEVFSPPEQMVAGNPLIPQTDFYALGKSLIYAMAGGDLDLVEGNMIPSDVPKPMADLLSRLVTRHPLDRPDWEKEDLNETVDRMRVEAFGRSASGMRKLAV